MLQQRQSARLPGKVPRPESRRLLPRQGTLTRPMTCRAVMPLTIVLLNCKISIEIFLEASSIAVGGARRSVAISIFP